MSRILALSIALLAFGMTSAALAEVGRTPGAFAVSATGAATYSIPIWAPPGPRGLQPHIALTYNSHQGNGPLGVGWSISGLSSISRCNLTTAQDPAPAPISLLTGDGYCMDGQRLRLTGGIYGAAGSSYQTEVANFMTLSAQSSAGQGPSFFTATDRNAIRYSYGSAGNAQVVAPGGTSVLSWQLNQVLDPAGNTMSITYTTANGTSVPNGILWTPTSHGTTNYAYTMAFGYGARELAQNSTYKYVAGAFTTNANLLGSITIYNASAVVKEYFLTYQKSPTTGRDELISVTECADSLKANCLSPTTITYQNGGVGVSTTAAASNAGVSYYDFNGDGRPDMIYVSGSTYWVALSNGAGTGFAAAFNTQVPATGVAVFGDVLGSGADGMLSQNGSTFNYYTYQASSGTFTGVNTGVPVTAGLRYSLTDITGDGLPDLVGFNQTNHSIQTTPNMSTAGVPVFSSSPYTYTVALPGTPLTGAQHWYFSTGAPESSKAQRAFDFNGDGRQDVFLQVLTINVQTDVQAYHYYELISQGANSPFTIAQLPFDSQANPPAVFGYFNDDACTDVALATKIYYSGCNGAIPSTATITLATNGSIIGSVDWDGDGRTDILAGAPGSTLSWYQSTGTGFAAPQATPFTTPNFFVVIDLDGDGLDDIVLLNTALNEYSYYLHNGDQQPADLVTKFTDGFGNAVSVGYASLVSGNYTKYADATYPDSNYIGPLYVVNQANFSDPSVPAGTTFSQTFWYYGAWMSLQGRGFDGFAATRMIDNRSGLYDYRYYERVFPETGMKYQEIISNGIFYPSQSTGTPAVTTLNSTAYQQRFFPYFSSWTTKKWEVGGVENSDPISTTNANYTFDKYGNTTNIVTTITDTDPGSPFVGQSWMTNVTNTTDISVNTAADVAASCLGLLDQTQIVYSSTMNGTNYVTRTQAYTPDTIASCRIKTVVIEPNSNLYKVTEALTFDSFGNIATDTVTGANMPASPASRLTTNNWGTTGQFLSTQTDPSGATNTWTYSSAQSLVFGVPDSLKNANNLTTSWTYDAFGRRAKETRADGTASTWTWSLCASYCGWSNSVYQIAQTLYQTNGTTAIRTDTTLYDPVSRVTETSGPTLTGATGIVQTQYDSSGRVLRQSQPFLSGASSYQQNFSYDVLNRVTAASRPISSMNSTIQTTNYAYAGRRFTVFDPSNNTKSTVTDVNGWLRQTTDALGSTATNGYTVTNAYDAAGSLIGTTDSVGNALLRNVTYNYGIMPFLVAATDADIGAWTYTVDSLGERTGWTDANGHSFSMSYDALSRPLTRTELDLFTQWTWGSTPASLNVGQLIAECTSSGVGTSCGASPAYLETRSFDTLGRLSTRAITESGNPGNNTGGTFQFTYGYGTTGKINSLTYPISTAGVALNIQYAYQYGLLATATDATDTTATCGSTCVLWTANQMNSFGQITQETLGNGVVMNRSYDPVTSWLTKTTGGVGGGAALLNQSYLQDEDGNVIQRQNNNVPLTESFGYDHDNRLTCSALAATCTTSNVAYDGGAAGPGNISSQIGISYTYPAPGQQRPHAVTSIIGTFGGIVNPSFSYDANGNMTARASTTSNIVWSSYNYPTSISSVTPAGSESVALIYGPDRQRWKQTYTGPTGTEFTYYLGGLVDLVFTGGVANYRHYIYAGNEPVAVYSRTATGVNTMSYMLEDHQGSISSITSKAGAVDVNESFAPFGYRRNPSTWSGAPSATDLATIASLSRQGYTDQTVLGQYMGLNHMNGRVQDALLGRFLSPDPYIPDPTYAQSYNRYSYVLNNPLTLTDPSGFASCRGRVDDSCREFNADIAQGVAENRRIQQAFDSWVNDLANSIDPWVGVPTVIWDSSRSGGTAKSPDAAEESPENPFVILASGVLPQSTAPYQVQNATSADCDAACQSLLITVTTSRIPVPATGGTINWGYTPLTNYQTYGGPSYGANIIFRYNGNPQGLNWRQIKSINGQLTQDCNPGGCPYYYSAGQLAQSNVSGSNFLTFLDQPSSLPGNVTWIAQTSLVQGGVPLITMRWGYNLNGTAITLVPLTYFYPPH